MKEILALAALATLPSLAGARAETSWTGSNLAISGNRSNGCDLRVIEVSHNGSTLNSVRFVLLNRAQAAVRAAAEVNILSNTHRKSTIIIGLIPANQQATLTGFHPFRGSLAGSTMAIRFIGCTAG